jgi:hypothetical protein
MNVFKAGRISTNVKAVEKALAHPCAAFPSDPSSPDTLWSTTSN